MSLESLLAADTFSVEKPQTETDASGGIVPGWISVATGVNGRVEDLDATTVQRYAAQGASVSHVVYTQMGGMQVGWRILTSDGLVLSVVESLKERGDLGTISTFWNVICKAAHLGGVA